MSCFEVSMLKRLGSRRFKNESILGHTWDSLHAKNPSGWLSSTPELDKMLKHIRDSAISEGWQCTAYVASPKVNTSNWTTGSCWPFPTWHDLPVMKEHLVFLLWVQHGKPCNVHFPQNLGANDSSLEKESTIKDSYSICRLSDPRHMAKNQCPAWCINYMCVSTIALTRRMCTFLKLF